jgi:uncharacterized protein
MISRQEAMCLLEEYNKDRSDFIHYMESEAIMGALAKKLGEDESYWKMLGLLHDIDWGITKTEPTSHLAKAPEILRKAGFDDNFIETVLSHGYGWDCAGLKDMKRTKKIEFALAASETVTGLIHAYAILRGGIAGMEVSGLKKRMKDKRFAAGVNRELIMECEKIGLSLDEFLEIAIKALQDVADELGLGHAKAPDSA